MLAPSAHSWNSFPWKDGSGVCFHAVSGASHGLLKLKLVTPSLGFYLDPSARALAEFRRRLWLHANNIAASCLGCASEQAELSFPWVEGPLLLSWTSQSSVGPASAAVTSGRATNSFTSFLHLSGFRVLSPSPPPPALVLVAGPVVCMGVGRAGSMLHGVAERLLFV